DVLAVVALAVGQAEQPLLQVRVLPVPEGQREAEPLVIVRHAGGAGLAPAISAGARMSVSAVLPGVAALAGVFSSARSLSFAEVRPTALAFCSPRSLLHQAASLRIERYVV